MASKTNSDVKKDDSRTGRKKSSGWKEENTILKTEVVCVKFEPIKKSRKKTK